MMGSQGHFHLLYGSGLGSIIGSKALGKKSGECMGLGGAFLEPDSVLMGAKLQGAQPGLQGT